MKIRHIIITIVTAALLVLALQSCSLFGTSKDARIEMFVDDLNYDRYNCYTNFHPDLCSDYNSLKDPTSTLNLDFPTAYNDYDVYNLNESGDTMTGTIQGYGGAGFGPQSITFYMAKDGLFDWKIERLDSPSGIVLYQ